MDTKDAQMMVGLLKAAFPSANIGPETVKVYAKYMADVDPAAARRAVDRLIVTQRYFPTIGEIRQEIVRESCGLPSPEDAWLTVDASIKPHPFVDTYIQEGELPKLVQRVVDAIGTQEIGRNRAASRAHFLRLYGDSMRREIEDMNERSLAAPAGSSFLGAGSAKLAEEQHGKEWRDANG